MRVIVCGGRRYFRRQEMFGVLDSMHAERPITELVHGDAIGADKLAGEWAKRRGVKCVAMPADWRGRGYAAGPERNARMLKTKPDLVIAFSGGRGTANMVKQATAAKVPVQDERRACDKTQHIRYATQAAAVEALEQVRVRAAAGDERRRENGAYRCDYCGGWHLTSHAKSNTLGVDSDAVSA